MNINAAVKIVLNMRSFSQDSFRWEAFWDRLKPACKPSALGSWSYVLESCLLSSLTNRTIPTTEPTRVARIMTIPATISAANEQYSRQRPIGEPSGYNHDPEHKKSAVSHALRGHERRLCDTHITLPENAETWRGESTLKDSELPPYLLRRSFW
jgi:hypothetical protein